LRISPLGGVGEVGKNITLLEVAGEILVIDCGLAFPEPEMLGIDLVIPDVTYLAENKDRVRAILLTHGHEDHTGALPYVLPHLPGIPIYASRLTIGLVTGKLREHKLLDATPLRTVEAGMAFSIGSSSVTPFRVNHSIPDGVGFAIQTPLGTVVHTGGFKFDMTPPDGRRADLGLIAEIGNRGVDFLLSDSTRAERDGYTLSERTVGESLTQLIGEAPSRVIVATFASNIGRVQQVIDAAAAFEKKMVVLGRSMEQNTAIALELGYLDDRGGTLVKRDQLQRLPKEETVIMTTGSQGDPMSGLTRMSNRDHRTITIEPADTVIVSASPIPGPACEGEVVVELTLVAATRAPVSGPDRVGRGFVSAPAAPSLEEGRIYRAEALTQRPGQEPGAESGFLKAKTRDTLAGFFDERTK